MNVKRSRALSRWHSFKRILHAIVHRSDRPGGFDYAVAPAVSQLSREVRPTSRDVSLDHQHVDGQTAATWLRGGDDDRHCGVRRDRDSPDHANIIAAVETAARADNSSVDTTPIVMLPSQQYLGVYPGWGSARSI